MKGMKGVKALPASVDLTSALIIAIRPLLVTACVMQRKGKAGIHQSNVELFGGAGCSYYGYS
jgi:hypothetical protein